MWGGQGGYDSAHGGGGYSQSPGGFGSPSATQSERKSRLKTQSVIPCTVSQLLSCESMDDGFKIRGVELAQVSIVGIIRQAEKAPTNVLYKIDDMTAAPMDVRQWIETDENENVEPPGTYVKVNGHMRSFQTKNSLVAFRVVPLEDMNEFTSHLLEVVNAHLILRKANMPASVKMDQSFGALSNVPTYGGSAALPVSGLSPQQSQILNLIKGTKSTEGMSLQELKSQLHNMNLQTVKSAIEFLSSEGHIYSTVDDDHFKSTDAD